MAKHRRQAITPVNVLLDVLDCAFDKQGWHGANLTSALRGVTPAQAIARPPGRKCIWDQLLHAAYWKHRVLAKLAGTERFPRKGSNWPKLPEGQDKAAWRADHAMLKDIHRALRAAVAALPDSALDEKTVWLIHGAAAHDLYHAGQIKLLRRLSPRPSGSR
jgi:hypothetical protein